MQQNMDLIKEINKLRKQKEALVKGPAKTKEALKMPSSARGQNEIDEEWEWEQIAHKRMTIQNLRE